MKFGNSTKQLFKQSSFFALALTIAVVSCKGPEGEVGPKGDTGATGAQGITGDSYDKALENGFLKGTIQGTRKDGTAFEEAFEYKLTNLAAKFESVSSTEHTIHLNRFKSVFGDNNSASMGLQVTNKDQAGATAKLNGAYFYFQKELSGKKLFLISAEPRFTDRNMVLPMSKENNKNYKLVDYGLNFENYSGENNERYVIYKDTDGNSIYFAEKYYFDGSTGWYNPFSYIISSDGVKSTSSEIWNGVRWYEGNKFRSSTGVDLSETINVPADTQEITNFGYNPTTGLLSFDYKIIISELRSLDNSIRNTTMHPLEIKGSFSGTVYNGVVMRKSFE
ncbi:hypothetical protein Q0590_12405 [Rhodocytophaga aerolata]|uniref:Collagen-like protein n=1 Tax=Rhodocytophaga aerolata TaxID=455078 RepID=A0ABT8R4N2_9BACT|nr:hypothetical protein [Rhodocytophaga aerolata]MDO1447061.1 hypothetical protein [Rhodocytophaga aerolata]